MSKNKQKTEIVWNTEVISALASNYDFSKRYIKQIISGERHPIFEDQVIAEYKSKCKEMSELLNKKEL